MTFRKKEIIAISLTIFSILFITGCTDFFQGINKDPIVKRAEPYLEKIDLNNSILRDLGLSITNNCSTNECIINNIYRYIIENFDYKQDPENIELIKTPFETINDGGGDCEDLSILLISLLENLGIKSYLVMNETHAYSLAFDVNTSLMWKEIEKSFINKIEIEWGEDIYQNFQDSLILKRNELWYYGGNGGTFDQYVDYLNISYDIISDKPFDFYIVPSKDDYINLSSNKKFNFYEDFEEKNILSIKDKISYMNRFGGIILYNKYAKSAKLDINLSFYFHPSFYEYFKNYSIKQYDINDKNCIVLDCTVGEWGYPGYDAGIEGEKIAISPSDEEYFFLS